jgi:NADPH2:quinone reductase
MAAMEAIRHHAFGPPEVLALEQVPDPAPGPGQVLVAVTAHGVHLLDTTIRRGEAGGPLPLPELPTVPGREIAGSVTAVGDGVPGSWLGRRVVAHLGPVRDGGGYARLAAVAADALHALPDGIDAADAVAMIGTGRMAVMVLDVADVGADDVVVVTAAAGGIGSLAVQSALAGGAWVLALVGGPAKVRTLRGLAPDAGQRLAVVDYRAAGWEDAARRAVIRLDASRTGVARPLDDGPAPGADVVLDGVGGDLGAAAAGLLRPGGRLVVHGWSSGAPNPLATDGGLDVRPVVGPGAPDVGDLRPFRERALDRAARGEWRVLTHRVPLAEAARAHRELEERRTTGKVVLV